MLIVQNQPTGYTAFFISYTRNDHISAGYWLNDIRAKRANTSLAWISLLLKRVNELLLGELQENVQSSGCFSKNGC